jgi:hypothetical protein
MWAARPGLEWRWIIGTYWFHDRPNSGSQHDFSAQLAGKLGQLFRLISMQPIRRSNVSEHTAQRVRVGFRAGRWSGKLPGVRRMLGSSIPPVTSSSKWNPRANSPLSREEVGRCIRIARARGRNVGEISNLAGRRGGSED